MRRPYLRAGLVPSPIKKTAPSASGSNLFPANRQLTNGQSAPDPLRLGSPISSRVYSTCAHDAAADGPPGGAGAGHFAIARSLSLYSDADGSDESGSLIIIF